MRNCSILFLGVASAAALAAADSNDLLGSLPGHIAINDRLHVSAQPSVEALKKLKEAGVGTVIDLRPDDETPDLDEKAVVEKSGVAYQSLPIAGKAGLTKANVAAFDRLLTQAEQGKVLLHCASGNRVGAMMALRARWTQGKSVEESLAIGKASGLTGLAVEVTQLLSTDAASAASPR